MKRLVAIFTFLIWLPLGSASAQAPPPRFVSFGEFMEHVAKADLDSFVTDQTGTQLQKADLEQMRQHILSMYEEVEVHHSFIMDSQYFDCVPVEQQPSVRRLGRDKLVREIPSPQPAPDEGEAPTATPNRHGLPSPLTLGLKDSFGNAIHCDEGTIPMRRITLEEMSRFGTLQKFFQKTPAGADVPPASPPPAHKYAHAYQNIRNYGGNSWLNVWSPPINQGASHIFSLSQHWYVGGSGTNLQTVEGGWQAYPAKYGTPKSVIFIYWTADAYTSTGCYNLDCAAFVQVNSHWSLGGTFTNYSATGGTQWETQLQWKFTGGNWWLFLQGSGTYDAIGYYPGSIYRGGQLSRYATEIDYGGETVGSTSWPPMGGGAFANAGFKKAAYQRLIFYIDAAPTGHSASLRASQPSPRCYSLKLTPFTSGGTWGTYFYFGGPGGRSC